jgi:hypothetical protein
MKKLWLPVLMLSGCCWGQVHIGGHKLNLPGRKDNGQGGTPQVTLQGNAGASESSALPSGTTQPVTFTVQRLDESQGIKAHADYGCHVDQQAEKVSPGVYKINLVLEPNKEAGKCFVSMESIATKEAASINVFYLPVEVNTAAPDFAKFRAAKGFTFKTDDGQTIHATVSQAETKSDKETMIMLAGGPQGMMVLALQYPDKVMTTITYCVLEGTLKGPVATLEPSKNSPSPLCKIKTATVTAD